MRLLAILCRGKAREEGKIKPTATDTLHTQIYCVALNIKRHYTRLRSKGRAYDTRLCPFIGPTALPC